MPVPKHPVGRRMARGADPIVWYVVRGHPASGVMTSTDKDSTPL